MANEEKYPSNVYHNVQSRPLGERKEEKREELKPVADGKIKKPSFKQRLIDSFMMTTVDDIKEAIVWQWLVPGLKNLSENIVHMILFGGNGSPNYSNSRRGSGLGDIPYNRMYRGDRSKDEYLPSYRNRQPEVVMDSYDKAKAVLDAMVNEAEKYQRVTVKDLCTLANLPSDYAKSNWGWRNLTGSDIVQVRDGYLIKLPPVEEMK